MRLFEQLYEIDVISLTYIARSYFILTDRTLRNLTPSLLTQVLLPLEIATPK